MTQRAITYRAVRPQDFDAMHALVGLWDVTRNLGSWPWPPDEAFTQQRCRPFEGDGFVWAICRDDALIGTVSVVRGELGYMLHPRHSGQGVVQRAVRRALSHAFETLNVQTVHADIWADNLASRHILIKMGFELKVEEVEHALARDEPTASETYEVTRAAWFARTPPRLTTARLLLRPLEQRDASDVVRVAGAYEVAKWTGPLPHPYTDEDFQSYFERVQTGSEGCVWAIEHDGVWTGVVGVGPSLGYYLDPSKWARGFMTEAVGQVVNVWFDQMNASDLWSSYFIGNKGSQAVLRKTGFETADLGQSYSLSRGEMVEKQNVRLTRARWQSLRDGTVCDTAVKTAASQG